MPGPRSNLTLASAIRKTASDIPGTVAVQYVCDGLKKCIEDPSLGWPAAIASVTAAAGVVNPVTVAGLVGLGVAFGVNRFRHKQKEARQVEAELRKQAAEHQSMHDILLALQDGSLTVGLDELAQSDLREIVTEVFDKKVERLSDRLEGLFDESLDDLPPGPLRDELDNLRILAQDTNLIVHENSAALAKQDEKIDALMKKFEAMSPASQDATDSENTVLEAALVRLAKDAEQGVEAARRALQDKSPQEAGDYFTDKLAALDDAKQQVAQRIAEEEVQLSREAAVVLFRTGRIADAEQALERILTHHPDRDAINRLGHIAQLRGRLNEAENYYRQVLSLSSDDLSGQATALGNLGIIAQTRGDLDEAEKLHNQALDIDRQLGRLIGQANSLGNLGIIAEIRGDLDEAEKLYNQALDINRQLGRLEGQAIQLVNLGNIAQTRGDLDEAEKLHRESLAIERQLGRLEGQASDLGNLGIIAKTRGDLDQAEKLHNQALDINRQLGRLEGQAIALANLGNIAKLRNDRETARALWIESRDLYQRVGMPHRVKQLQGWLDELDAEGDG